MLENFSGSKKQLTQVAREGGRCLSICGKDIEIPLILPVLLSLRNPSTGFHSGKEKKTPAFRAGVLQSILSVSLEPAGSFIRFIIPAGHFMPVYHLEKGLDVIRATVLIMQIIGVFPHIDPQYGHSVEFVHVH